MAELLFHFIPYIDCIFFLFSSPCLATQMKCCAIRYIFMVTLFSSIFHHYDLSIRFDRNFVKILFASRVVAYFRKKLAKNLFLDFVRNSSKSNWIRLLRIWLKEEPTVFLEKSVLRTSVVNGVNVVGFSVAVLLILLFLSY